jgi:hypothetical protein
MPPDPGQSQSGRLADFTAGLLRHQGALVDPIEPDGLEVLATPEVRQALGVDELVRLGFGSRLPQAGTRVGLEGDWLDRFAQLLGPQGRTLRIVRMPTYKPPGDPDRLLSHELVLDNATYRLLGTKPAWTRYLTMDFRASAVSDDKRDFMLRIGVNLATGMLPDVILGGVKPFRESEEMTECIPEDATLPATWDRERLLDLVARALPSRLDEALGPFIKGLQRRLARDQDRLHQYHNDLHRAAMSRAAVLLDGDPKRSREEQRSAAIAREYNAKLDDLTRQYATRVKIEWVRTLELVMPVHRFVVQLRRRKADRTLYLDWNPLARRLESPVCEATWSTERPRIVCDDALHLVVPAGLSPCAGCGRAYCRACHPRRCPKCGMSEEQRAILGLLQDSRQHV